MTTIVNPVTMQDIPTEELLHSMAVQQQRRHNTLTNIHIHRGSWTPAKLAEAYDALNETKELLRIIDNELTRRLVL